MAPFFPRPRDKSKWEKQELVNAALYLVDKGCKWRSLPHGFPPYTTVSNYYHVAIKSGLWGKLLTVLVSITCEEDNRKATPSYGIIDSQSAKTAGVAEERGIDGGKTKGRKRLIVVDTMGNLLAVIVHAANDQHSKTTKNVTEELPEERIGAALKEHIVSIKQQVLDSILNNSPEFFEHLVLDLLLKMGYGYGKQAGVVTGRPHDGGIDGIISEDKLGLDLIYIRAKRYAPKNKIGRSELQAFIGAMEHIRKGVFIVTAQ